MLGFCELKKICNQEKSRHNFFVFQVTYNVKIFKRKKKQKNKNTVAKVHTPSYNWGRGCVQN